MDDEADRRLWRKQGGGGVCRGRKRAPNEAQAISGTANGLY